MVLCAFACYVNMRRLYLIELFGGSHSVSRSVKKGFGGDFDVRILSVDIDPKFSPTITADINKWRFEHDIDAFLNGRRRKDLIFVWASPPCREFSRALTTRPRDLKSGRRNVKSALRIIEYVQELAPRTAWFLENPVGLLKEQTMMRALEPLKNVVTYCKYGKPFKKPTNIWSNVQDLRLRACTSQTPCNAKNTLGRHLVSAQSGPTSNGTPGSGTGENVYPIPSRLVKQLFRRAIEEQTF